MKLSTISLARLNSQQITGSAFTRPEELVSYMGAMQAQDFAMVKWALGLRLPGTTAVEIEKELDKGNIIRTHVLRPTWHLISAADTYWMLALSSVKIKALMKTMDRQLGLTEKIFSKSNAIIEKALGEGKHVTRDVLQALLEKAKIVTKDNRLAHLLERAELEGIACSGALAGNQRTYALLSQRVPQKKLLNRDESLALLAKKYFTSRGPATIADFSWWSGLSLTDARHALEMIKPGLLCEKIDEQLFWFGNQLQWPASNKMMVHLLPAFDEFIISYKDRTACLAKDHHRKVLTVNGIFYPTIIVKGQVAGLWKRYVQKDQLAVETGFFSPQNKSVHHLLAKQVKVLGKFSAMKIKIAPGKI